MTNLKRKIISCLLTLALVFTTLPLTTLPAWAADSDVPVRTEPEERVEGEIAAGGTEDRVDVALDKENFPDENFRDYIAENFDTDGDGVLSGETEIPYIVEVNLNNPDEEGNDQGLGISDLTGIEHLTALSLLDCDGNQLTELKNLPESLWALNCNDNQIEEIEALPPCLESIECSGNKLTYLPELPSDLVLLYCEDNQLIELPELPDTLEQISCEYNQLTSLPQLPASLESLHCEANQIEGVLDVSGCAKLNDLLCQENQLTGIRLHESCQYDRLEVWGNYIASKDDVTGQKIDWSETGFVFEPQLGDSFADLEIVDIRFEPMSAIEYTNGGAMVMPGAVESSLQWIYSTRNPNYTIVLDDGTEITSDSGVLECTDSGFYFKDKYYYFDYTDYQEYERWGVGDHIVKVSVQNIETSYNFHVSESPIEEIYFDVSDLEIEIGTHGWCNESNDGSKWFEYAPVQNYTVVMKDGTTISSMDPDNDATADSFTYDGHVYQLKWESDQREENPWGLGEHYFWLTVDGLMDMTQYEWFHEGEILVPVNIICSEHVWDKGTILEEPTCTDPGNIIYHCLTDGCDAEYMESIEAKGHTVVNDQAVAATCTKAGKTAGSHCSVCGTVIKAQKAVPAKGHTEKATTTKATFSANGKVVTKCSVCNVTLSSKLIYRAKSASLSKTKYTYDGKVKKPTVTVKNSVGKVLKEGTDYTVTYSKGRAKTGRYKAVVNLKGKFTGSETLYFTIVPKAPTNLKTELYGHDDIRLSWKKSTGATGYTVYYKRSTDKNYKLATRLTGTAVRFQNLYDGSKYQFKVLAYYKSGGTRYGAEKYATTSTYTLKQMSTPKASKSGTKAKISWSKMDGAHGYHVAQYVKKNGKYVKVKGYFTTSTSKLFTATKGKTYYYKVRAYDKVNGKRIFAPWSKMKAYKRT